MAAASGIPGSGGGILNAQGPPGTTPAVLAAVHSRIDHNSAGGDGGGIANGVPLPGPMPLPGGDVTLKNSQVMHNNAAHGGGIFNAGGTVTLSHTSVTDNHVDTASRRAPSPAALASSPPQRSARRPGTRRARLRVSVPAAAAPRPAQIAGTMAGG